MGTDQRINDSTECDIVPRIHVISANGCIRSACHTHKVMPVSYHACRSNQCQAKGKDSTSRDGEAFQQSWTPKGKRQRQRHDDLKLEKSKAENETRQYVASVSKSKPAGNQYE